MVQSILDNDLYKFTMQNAVVKLFPRAKARYEFIDRNNTVFPEGFVEKLKFNVDELSNLKLTKEEKKFLDKKCYYFDQTYLDFLMGYRFDPSEVEIIQIGTKLKITIEDFWYRAILWEVPLLATISTPARAVITSALSFKIFATLVPTVPTPIIPTFIILFSLIFKLL